MDPKQILEEAIKRFQGKGPELGHIIGDYDATHNMQTYGSGGENASVPTMRLYSDLVEMVTRAQTGMPDSQKAERQVKAAMAIIRQAEYTKQDPLTFDDSEIASAINSIGNSTAPIGEMIFNGQGALLNLENMKQGGKATIKEKVKTDEEIEQEKYRSLSVEERRVLDKKNALAKATEIAKIKGLTPDATGKVPGSASAIAQARNEISPSGGIPSQSAQDAFSNLPGAEAAYAALSPAQIAAGLPSTLEGGFSPFAQQTYRKMLSPLAADSGVFDFLSVAGLAPRMAMPNDPTTVNEALSFRAFLSQDPSSITQNITQGLELLESAKTKASTNMQSFLAGVGSTTEERTLYQAFLDDPSKEFALRSALADRAYPGAVGDAVKGALADQYYSTLSTNPIALSQPGFYKNAFQNYMPTGTLTNFVTSTGKSLTEDQNNQVLKVAGNDVADAGTPANVAESQVNKTESAIARVTGEGLTERPTDAITSQAAKDFISGATPAPATTQSKIDAGINKFGSNLFPPAAAAAAPIAPIDPANLALDDMGGLPPIGVQPQPVITNLTDPMAGPDSPYIAPTPISAGPLGASRGLEMLDPRASYGGVDNAYNQLFGPNAMGATTLGQAGQGNVNPLLDDLGMNYASVAPSRQGIMQPAGEMVPGRQAWQLDQDMYDMDAANYGYDQPAYRPTDAGDYYIPTETRNMNEMNDMGANILGPDASFAKQFPNSPMQPLTGGSLNGFSPAPQAPIRPGAMGGERYLDNPMSGPMADWFTQFPKITELPAAYRNFLTSGGYSPNQFSFQDFTNAFQRKQQRPLEAYTNVTQPMTSFAGFAPRGAIDGGMGAM